VIKDSKLIAMVVVLLLMDVLLLLSWTLFARRDVDKIDLPQLVRCHCLMHVCTESSLQYSIVKPEVTLANRRATTGTTGTR
jgi:hypothetical protein